MDKEICTCCDCGYQWKHGQHGGHSCAVVLKADLATIRAQVAELKQEILRQQLQAGCDRAYIADLEREHKACLECEQVEQILGKAMGYPWYMDDQQNFPGSTEKEGVCTGEDVPSSLALKAGHLIVYRPDADGIIIQVHCVEWIWLEKERVWETIDFSQRKISPLLP